MTAAEFVRGFIVEECQWDGPGAAPADDLPLIENEIIDSYRLLHLVEEIEGTFGIVVEDLDLVKENFGTIGAIINFIDRRLANDGDGRGGTPVGVDA